MQISSSEFRHVSISNIVENSTKYSHVVLHYYTGEKTHVARLRKRWRVGACNTLGVLHWQAGLDPLYVRKNGIGDAVDGCFEL